MKKRCFTTLQQKSSSMQKVLIGRYLYNIDDHIYQRPINVVNTNLRNLYNILYNVNVRKILNLRMKFQKNVDLFGYIIVEFIRMYTDHNYQLVTDELWYIEEDLSKTQSTEILSRERSRQNVRSRWIDKFILGGAFKDAPIFL